MRVQPRICAALLPLLLPIPLAAVDAPTELEPVVVTATRTPEPESAILASVSVVERAEIESRQALSVPDLLRGLSGVAVNTGGGPGQPASIFLRGTNAGHVLVLVDGIKVGSASLGTVPFQDLPLAQIDRVEMVRGPRSSLYGSEAIGGVIQIFTRRGGGPLTPRGSLSTGSYGTAGLSGGLSGGGEQGWFNLGGSFEQTDGFNACEGQPVPFAGCGVYEPDRDGYRNQGASARAGYRFSERAELDLHLLSSGNETDFDGGPFSGNSSRSEQRVLGATARLVPLDPWTLTVSGGRSQDQYRAYYAGAFLDRFDTERDLVTLQSDLAVLPGQLATLGLDYQVDRVDGTVDYTEDSRDNLGVFGEYQADWWGLATKLSLRQDDNQQFGTHATGSLALGHVFNNGVRTTLSYGTAFKAPTFNDLYYPVFGNPALSPEESRSLELGLGGSLVAVLWDLRLYQTDIDELIAFDPFSYQVSNIDEARIRGLEASTSLVLWGWDLSGNLTLLDPENRTNGPNRGNTLPRRPQESLTLDLKRQLGPWSLGATVNYAGRRFDDLANRVRLDPYTLLDLRAEYGLSESVRLQGRIANLLDTDYETADFYNQAGRALYVTLRYEP